MFEPSETVMQAIDLQKGTFTSLYDTVSMMQDQAVSAMDMMLDQAGVVPEEGRKSLSSWVNACKQERGRLKTYMDTGFSNLEKLITKQIGK